LASFLIEKGRFRGPPFFLAGIKRLIPNKDGQMVIFFPVILKELSEKARSYPWPKPERCPKCGACRVWGHGYFMAIFDGFRQLLLLKRYRCPDCGCVIRCRPAGYFKRFQAPIHTIRESISSKGSKGRWLPDISRTRQAHWWRALTRRAAAFLEKSFCRVTAEDFDRLQVFGKIPVTRSI